MKLIVGLGNIGEHYQGTRHNIGFAAVDAIAVKHSAPWQQKDKFKAIISEFSVEGEKVILAKPTTFYNLTGEAARAIKDFYKLDNTEILVIHDELALPFGTIRTRQQGSDAGNNGVKSIIAHLGADITRIRIGIANQHLPSTDAADFVLSQFNHEEKQQISTKIKETSQLASQFIQGEILHSTVKI